MEHRQAAAEGDRRAVLDEGGVAVDADAVDVVEEFVLAAGHGRLHVVAQVGQAHPQVLEEIVVRHLRMVEREHGLEVAALPAMVIAQDHFASAFGEMAVRRREIVRLHGSP
ncbi:hypothetical protein D3C81_1538470 [compost metagenome]